MTGETKAKRFKAYAWMTLKDILEARSVRAANGCRYWTGSLHKGYGRQKYKGVQHMAHIWAYMDAHDLDEIPPGYQVDHTCHNEDPACVGRGDDCLHRRCIEASHLRLATPETNTNAPTGANVKKTHCPEGHEYTPESTTVTGSGSRMCRTCSVGRTREWKRRQREAEGRLVKICGEEGCTVKWLAQAGAKKYCDEHGKSKYAQRRLRAKKAAK